MKRHIPILSWFPGYDRRWLPADLIAGFTNMGLLVPEGLEELTIIAARHESEMTDEQRALLAEVGATLGDFEPEQPS